jgi:hypothetical protein
MVCWNHVSFDWSLARRGHKQKSSSWLTNSALLYEPNAGGGGCGVSPNEHSCAHAQGAQINVGDLTPHLTYACSLLTKPVQDFDLSFIQIQVGQPKSGQEVHLN